MSSNSPERAQAFLDVHGDRLRNAAPKDASRKSPAAAQSAARDIDMSRTPHLDVGR